MTKPDKKIQLSPIIEGHYHELKIWEYDNYCHVKLTKFDNSASTTLDLGYVQAGDIYHFVHFIEEAFLFVDH